MSRPSPLRLCAFLTTALASLAACRDAGVRSDHGLDGPLAGLAWLPEETAIVLALDLDRLRGQPIWKTLSPTLAKHVGPALDGIAAGTGIELTRQAHRLWVGLPGQRQADGRFALVLESDPVDAARVETWIEKRAPGALSVRLANSRWLVISKGAWTQRMGGPHARPRSAADNRELRRLCQRSAGQHALWVAALVPLAVRRALLDSAHFADVASLLRGYGFLDDTAGLHAELVGEFGNTNDPPLVAHRLNVLHNQGKRNPDMLVAGLSPYLEAVRVEARQAEIRITLDLPDAQSADVIEHIEALARTTRTKYSPAP